MKHMLAVLLVLGLVVAQPSAEEFAEGAVVAMSLSDLAKGADAVFSGHVVSKTPQWTADNAMINTAVKFAVVDQIKGNVPEGLVLTIPGGDLDGVKVRNAEAPTFGAGEKAICFVKFDEATGSYSVLGWFQGKYTVLNGMVRELNGISEEHFRAEILAAAN